MNAVLNMPARFRKKNLFIEMDKVEQEGNICYSTVLTEGHGHALAKQIRELGFELEYKKITAISVKDVRVVLNPDDSLFKEGYEYIDMNKIGLPDTFPKEWLNYNPVMPMKKYFENDTSTSAGPTN